MSAQLSVGTSAEAEVVGTVAQVIASLPVSLRPASRVTDLVAVSGKHWIEDAVTALESGARGLMVINPGPATIMPAVAGVPVVVDSTWAYNPAVAAAAPHFAALNDTNGVFEARTDSPLGSDLEQVLLAQLALVRAAVGGVRSLTVDRWNEHGYDAHGQLNSGASLALGAALSNGGGTSAILRVLTKHNAVRLHLPDPATATCGTVTVSGPDGATTLPTLWETPHRSAWRELHRRVEAGESTSDLDDLLADIATLRTAR